LTCVPLGNTGIPMSCSPTSFPRRALPDFLFRATSPLRSPASLRTSIFFFQVLSATLPFRSQPSQLFPLEVTLPLAALQSSEVKILLDNVSPAEKPFSENALGHVAFSRPPIADACLKFPGMTPGNPFVRSPVPFKGVRWASRESLYNSPPPVKFSPRLHFPSPVDSRPILKSVPAVSGRSRWRASFPRL